MALIDNIKRLFTKASYQDRQDSGRLPFIQLMGTEKTYGKPQPNDYAGMVAAYKSWAYACAWKNAISVAKCELCLKKPSYDNKKEKQEYVEVDTHPFLDLMKTVNPFSNRFELFTLTALNMELTGNAYWYIPRGPLGIPETIWNIPSHWVKIVPSQTNFIDGYVVSVPNKPTPIPFDETEIIHFKFPSPSDLFYGQGPLWGARLGIDLSNQVKEWGISFFLNNAQPSGILTTDMSLTPDQFQRLRDQWNEKYRGVRNAGKMAFLENGLKYQQMGSNVRDSQFPEVSQELRSEILACFGVPASKLGLESHDNRATAEASDYTYQKETILPRLILIQEKLNEKLIPIYDPRLMVEFENPVPEDKSYKLQERQVNLQTGFSSIDELRVEEGLDPYNLPETSVPLISFGLQPAGTPRPDPNESLLGNDPKEEKSFSKASREDIKWERFARATHPMEKAMERMMKRYFQQQHEQVKTNLNRFKSVSKSLYNDIIFNMNEANTDLKRKAWAYVNSAIVTGLKLGVQDTGHSIDFNLFNPNIIRAVEKRVVFFSEKTNETTAKLISEAIARGDSMQTITDEIDRVFKFRDDFSAKRIAQTEVVGGVNEGTVMSYREAGIEKMKWVTARDEKVRHSHQIEGQTVRITETFVTNDGNHLHFPGDRSTGAPASEVINCRCGILSVNE